MALRQMTASLISLRTAKTHPQSPVPATVAGVEDLTPTMRRITFTGPDLAKWPALGNDQYVRILLPRDNQTAPVLPEGARWYPALLAMQASIRPQLRTYTLRAVRPELAEADVDFVLHGDAGPASRWAAQASPGDPVGLIEQGILFAPDATAEHLLLVADDTGLPAALSILEQHDLPIMAVLEVTTAADEQPTPSHHQVTWLHRLDAHAKPGQLALAHVPTLPSRNGRGQAWLAGESSMVTGLRRHLVRQCGYDKADVSFTGYFKYGRAQYAD